MRTLKTYNFCKGLITETSPLAYPENAALSITNYDLFRTGLIARRLGLDAELGFVLNPQTHVPFSSLNNAAIGSDVWNSVAKIGDKTFNVVQIYNKLYFHDMSASGAISVNKFPFEINLQTYAKNTAIDAGNFKITGVSAAGIFIVSSLAINPFYIKFDPVASTFTVVPIVFMTRDLDGLDDGLAPNQNPTTLSAQHYYNLLNQSWNVAQINSFYNHYGYYPSNAQVPYEAKDADGNFDPTQFANIVTGTTQVARGKFLVNIFNIDYSAVSGVPGLKPLITDTRPIGMCYYTGRIWLAVGNRVYYSQIIINDPKNIANLYQAQDPTAEIFNELLPSDGGYISFLDAGNINSLLATETSVIVGANNGLWAISGWSGQDFNATNFRTAFAGTMPVLGANNLCQVEDTIWVVSVGGVYILGTDERGNIVIIGNEPITQRTIQTFFLEIPISARQQSTIFYDPSAKKVYILYDGDSTGQPGENKFQYTNQLIYDMSLGVINGNFMGWTTRTLSNPSEKSCFISDAYLLNNPIVVGIEENVLVGDDQIYINGVDPVVISDFVPIPQEVGIGYLLISGDATNGFQYTFGQFDNQGFFDFPYVDNVGGDYTAYLITGWQDDTYRQKDMLYQQRYQIDVSKLKGVPYVLTYMQRTEQNVVADDDGEPTYDFPSSTYLQAVWDWSNQYGDFLKNRPQQVYRFKKIVPLVIGQPFEYPYDVIESKTMLRGHGKCLSLMFSSETGKDSRLWGWMLEYQIADFILS